MRILNKIKRLCNELFWNEFRESALTNKTKIIRDISVTLLSFLVPMLIFVLQIKHDENSLRPYINFNLTRNKDSVDIVIKNAGVGPAIIEDIVIKQNGEIVNADSLYDGIDWDKEYSFTCNDGMIISNKKLNDSFVTDYYIDFIGDTLAPGEEKILLKYTPDEEEGAIVEQIRIMRYALTKMETTIKYTDIYDNKFNKTENFSTYVSQFVLK